MYSTSMFKKLMASMHFCCIYAFIRSMRGVSNAKVATRLGVHVNTFRYWKKQVRLRRCECEHTRNCALKRLGEIPRVDVDLLGKRTSDPFV